MKWVIYCGDVRAAFLSGKNFARELIVKLPNDCAALLGVTPPCYMKMLKSAYGLSDAPLLWYEEADNRLQQGGLQAASQLPRLQTVHQKVNAHSEVKKRSVESQNRSQIIPAHREKAMRPQSQGETKNE